MKKEDAEKLICPFISRDYITKCMTIYCMAWEKIEGEGYCIRLEDGKK